MKPRIDSLRARLVIGLMTAILVVWAIGMVVQYRVVAREQTGVWDASLQAIGRQILLSLPQVDDNTRAQSGDLALPPTLKKGKGWGASFIYQAWRRDGAAILRSSGAPGPPMTALDFNADERFSTFEHGGERWRIYAVVDATRQVQVQLAKSERAYAETMAAWLGSSLLLSFGLMAVLGSVAWWVVTRTLAPTARLGLALQQREPLDLRPVPTDHLPCELRPMITSFNAVLARLDDALQGERRFLADAAHELRTPLAVLRAQAQGVERAADLQQCRQAMRPLVDGIERTTRLSEQLLDLARVDALEDNGLARHPIHELLALVAHDFAAAARRRNQRLLLMTAPCEATVAVDALGVLLRNLIDNAIRHAGTGARIEVVCHQVGTGGIRIEVRDDGPGVPEAERERVFDRFYRLAGTHERGGGIGLSLVRRVAELHRAELEAGPGLDGRGFAVSLLLATAGPMGQSMAAASPSRAMPAPASQAGRIVPTGDVG